MTMPCRNSQMRTSRIEGMPIHSGDKGAMIVRAGMKLVLAALPPRPGAAPAEEIAGDAQRQQCQQDIADHFGPLSS